MLRAEVEPKSVDGPTVPVDHDAVMSEKDRRSESPSPSQPSVHAPISSVHPTADGESNSEASAPQCSRGAEDDDQPLRLTRPTLVSSTLYLPRDIQLFLLNYPNQRPYPNHSYNLRFYRNEIPFRPHGVTIDEFHAIACENYRLLERHHAYIQWIFPIREQGLNYASYPLQVHEAHAIRGDEECQIRLRLSFKLMLDFYGMDLDEDNPLLISRHQDLRVCGQRYLNLMSSCHNYLRITRILKSLCELGQDDYVPSFLLFVLAEQSQYETLDTEEIKSSMDHYWVYCMRKRDAQSCVAEAVKWVRDDGQFHMDAYQRIAESKQTTGRWEFNPQQEGLQKGIKRERRETGYFLRRQRSRNALLE